MKTLVLLVLALAWITVLGFWLRSRSQDATGDSVGLFHRHLNVLQKAAPPTRVPANRLRASDHHLHAAFGHRRVAVNSTIPRAVSPRGAIARGSTADVLAQTRLRQTRRRRRDVLFMLVILCVATFIVAAVIGSGPAIFAQITTDIVLVGYIAMLVRIRSLAVERDAKLRVMYPYQPLSRPQAARRQARPRPAPRPRPRPVPVPEPVYEYDYGYADQAYEDYDDSGGYVLPGYGLATGS